MQDLPYASRLNRLVGQIIDGFIGAAPLIAAVMFASFGRAFGAVLLIVAIAWSVFYYFFADGFTGGQSFGERHQRLGDMVAGTVVITEMP